MSAPSNACRSEFETTCVYADTHLKYIAVDFSKVKEHYHSLRVVQIDVNGKCV